ncbi:hypothetical protein [Phenylobacterium sp.]|uniref:hypothetical protein n=1 Tax=Phenylobacterium sp. TaxID=1871053 RepID=UPI002FE3632F
MSALDPEALARARALVAPKPRRERVWPVLAAATLAAVSALTFATAMVIAPPVETEAVAGTVE